MNDGLQRLIFLLLLVSILILQGCAVPRPSNNAVYPEAKASYEFGLQQMKARKYQEAISSFQKAIALNKNYVNAYENLGWAYFSVLDLDNAEAQWREALAIDPEAIQAHLGIGYLHFIANEYDEAIKSFEAAILSDSRNSSAHEAIGRVYYEQGLIEKAITELRKSIELNPNAIMSYWVLGEIYTEKGMTKEAQDCKDEAMAIFKRLKEKESGMAPE